MEIVDQDGVVYEFDDRKIVKLKPGIAYGAGDIQNWAIRRTSGRSGVRDRKADKKEIKRVRKLVAKAGRTIKSFDGRLIRPKKNKTKKRKLTQYELYKKQKKQLLSLRKQRM